MPAIPLFTRAELQAAFGLILPNEVARVTAERWWSQFADDVDARGYFLYEDPLERAGLSTTTPQVLGTTSRLTKRERRAQERAFWGSMTIEERTELLMRFSSFHFGLLSLVSDDLHERMRAAQGLTHEQADNGRAQMRRIVAAIGS